MKKENIALAISSILAIATVAWLAYDDHKRNTIEIMDAQTIHNVVNSYSVYRENAYHEPDKTVEHQDTFDKTSEE